MLSATDSTKCSRLATIKPGDPLPVREYKPDSVQLFMYNAAIWNAHRIHFDHPYSTDVEGYPDLVIPGPLMGDWLTQCVLEWMGDEGQLLAIEYSNRQAAYLGETLHSQGKVISCDYSCGYKQGEVKLEVSIKNKAGEIIVPGLATVRFCQP